jgi:8-oxo-dGTP diphosphatase
MVDSDVDPRLQVIDDCLYRLSVKAIVVDDKKLLMVQERDDEWWGLPGGGIDYGENNDQALRRELHEELGVDPQQIQYDSRIRFMSVGTVVDGVPRANLFYRVQLSAEQIVPTKDVLEARWVTAAEISELHLSPSIGSILEQLKMELQADA